MLAARSPAVPACSPRRIGGDERTAFGAVGEEFGVAQGDRERLVPIEDEGQRDPQSLARRDPDPRLETRADQGQRVDQPGMPGGGDRGKLAPPADPRQGRWGARAPARAGSRDAPRGRRSGGGPRGRGRGRLDWPPSPGDRGSAPRNPPRPGSGPAGDTSRRGSAPRGSRPRARGEGPPPARPRRGSRIRRRRAGSRRGAQSDEISSCRTVIRSRATGSTVDAEARARTGAAPSRRSRR